MSRERKEPRAKAPPEKVRAHPMAALLGDVAPLRSKPRVARLRDPRASPDSVLPSSRPERREISFVVERDGERVHGYRSDLAAPRIAPGRARDWTPELRVDLHGVRVRDVDAHVQAAIKECSRRPGARLLVIHGKGLHSAGGRSVLADAVIECLTAERHARRVRAFATAPERLGGEGALAVELVER